MQQVIAVIFIAAGVGAATGAVTDVEWGVFAGGILLAFGAVGAILDVGDD